MLRSRSSEPRRPPAQRQRVVEAEMQLLTAMDFQLVLFQPQSEVQRALQQYMHWCAGHSRCVGESQVHMLQRGAAEHLRNAMRGDAPLLYPPAALSLAALSLAADALPNTEGGGSSGGSSAPSFQDFISEILDAGGMFVYQPLQLLDLVLPERDLGVLGRRRPQYPRDLVLQVLDAAAVATTGVLCRDARLPTRGLVALVPHQCHSAYVGGALLHVLHELRGHT